MLFAWQKIAFAFFSNCHWDIIDKKKPTTIQHLNEPNSIGAKCAFFPSQIGRPRESIGSADFFSLNKQSFGYRCCRMLFSHLRATKRMNEKKRTSRGTTNSWFELCKWECPKPNGNSFVFFRRYYCCCCCRFGKSGIWHSQNLKKKKKKRAKAPTEQVTVGIFAFTNLFIWCRYLFFFRLFNARHFIVRAKKNADNFDIRILLIHHTEIKCFFIHFDFFTELSKFSGCFWFGDRSVTPIDVQIGDSWLNDCNTWIAQLSCNVRMV